MLLMRKSTKNCYVSSPEGTFVSLLDINQLPLIPGIGRCSFGQLGGMLRLKPPGFFKGDFWSFFMGKSTISMAIFNSKLLVYQRVTKKIFSVFFSQAIPIGMFQYLESIKQ